MYRKKRKIKIPFYIKLLILTITACFVYLALDRSDYVGAFIAINIMTNYKKMIIFLTDMNDEIIEVMDESFYDNNDEPEEFNNNITADKSYGITTITDTVTPFKQFSKQASEVVIEPPPEFFKSKTDTTLYKPRDRLYSDLVTRGNIQLVNDLTSGALNIDFGF